MPDSSWFTNRIGSRPLTLDELMRGPVVGPAPAPQKWTLTREKSAGAAPGFTAQDANGETWFVSFDANANPRGATGAVVVSTKIFWALGYNQVEYFVTELRRDSDRRSTPSRDEAPPLGQAHADDGQTTCSEMLERADRACPTGRTAPRPDACCPARCSAASSTTAPGRTIPNDIVPHEHRRELRALRVFGAWTNLTDMKAGNTLDTVVTEGGTELVRHYLQDVGSTFGVGANGPHDWNEGWEHIYEGGADAEPAVHLRVRPQPLADGRLRGLSRRRPLRRRLVRSR